MLTVIEENKLCDLMIEIGLMMEYRDFNTAATCLERILVENAEYLPAKEALHEVYCRTGQTKRSQDLAREIRALERHKAKESLSDTAREELAKIEGRQFAEQIAHFTRVIYQGRTSEEVLLSTAIELLNVLKADRCVVYLKNDKSEYNPQVYSDAGVSQDVDAKLHDFLLDWLDRQSPSRDPISVQKMQSDPLFASVAGLIQQHQLHSLMAFPLVYKSKVTGWVTVHQCVPFYLWTEDDRSLFSTACGHLATALENLRALDQLHDKAYKDALTGLFNRHFLKERLVTDIASAQHQGHPLSLALLDIDRFKQINDTHGHAAGDTTLTKVAFLLRTNVRKSCTVARWGGEEFLVVFPSVAIEAATLIMDRFRDKLSQTLEIHGTPVTVSIGVVELPANLASSTEPVEDILIAAADEALYQAKQEGRNRVVVSRLGGTAEAGSKDEEAELDLIHERGSFRPSEPFASAL